MSLKRNLQKNYVRVIAKVAENSLEEEFGDWLKAFLNHKNARMLPHGAIFFSWLLLKSLSSRVKVDFLENFGRKGRRRLSICLIHPLRSLQSLLSIVPINNFEGDFILARGIKTLLFQENETFLRALVDKLEFDEDRNVKGSHGPFLVHYLVMGGNLTMLRFLLDRNVNMSTYGPCEEGLLPAQVACQLGNEELVAMLMYYNVSPHEHFDRELVSVSCFPPICFAIVDRLHHITDLLFDYTFDSMSCIYEIIFVRLLLDQSPHFVTYARLIQEHFNHDFYFDYYCSYNINNCQALWLNLTTIPNNYLRLSFETLYNDQQGFEMHEYLMCAFSYYHWQTWWVNRQMLDERGLENFMDNLRLLATNVPCGSPNGPTTLQKMLDKIHDKWPLRIVVDECIFGRNCSFEDLEEIIFLLLSNNAPLDSYTMDVIFCHTRHSHPRLFRHCQYLEVDWSEEASPEHYDNVSKVGSFYYRFLDGKTITEILDDPMQPSIRRYSDERSFYSCFSSHPKLNTGRDYPKLFQLARDAARKFVVQSCNVEHSWQFYSAVDKLDAPVVVKRAIAYDLFHPLYKEIVEYEDDESD